jgi:hypothetical protein
MMKKIKFILVVIVIVFTQNVFAQSKKQWIEDIDFLIQKYESIYPRFQQQVDKKKFVALVDHIKADIQPNNPNHNIMSLFRLHASLKDAHSVPMVFHPSYNLHAFPVRLHKFEEGWFVVDAMLEYKDLIGLRVKSIGSKSIESIYEKSSEIISFENEFGKMDRFEMFGLISEWLYDEHVIQAIDKAEFQFEDDNKKVIKRIVSTSKYIDVFKWINMTPLENDGNFALFNPRKQNYWFNFDKETKIVYFQFNSVSNQEGESTIAEFTNELGKTIKRKKPEKIIIDLRNNSGGDDSNLPPLLALFKNEKINQYGKLFVITGRHTFSSGLLFAWQLRMQTEAIFVGEPAAQGPVFNANADYVFLPNSKIGFTVSKTSTARNQPNWCFNSPAEVKVDLPVQYAIQDFKSNQDQALVKITNYKKTNSKMCEGLDLSGSYRLSDFHILNIDQKNKSCIMTITDFMGQSLFFVRKQLCSSEKEDVLSDANGVFALQKTDDQNAVKVSFFGQEIVANKRGADEILPMEAMNQKSYDKALTLFKQYADVYKRDYIKFEFYLTMAGYNLLKGGNVDMSLRFFELLIEIFPNSWNAYDSYAEALLQANQTEKAIANFKKSLELNPDNENGQKWLEKLDHK